MVARRTVIPTIIFSTVIGEDHRLVIDLPPDTPTGPAQVKVDVETQEESAQTQAHLTREWARAKLMAAGALSTAHNPPPGTVRPSEEEMRRAGTLPPGARPSEEIVDELRAVDTI